MVLAPGPSVSGEFNAAIPSVATVLLGPFAIGLLIERVEYLIMANGVGSADLSTSVLRVAEATESALLGGRPVIIRTATTTTVLPELETLNIAGSAIRFSAYIGLWVREQPVYIATRLDVAGTGRVTGLISVVTKCLLDVVDGKVVQLPAPGSA